MMLSTPILQSESKRGVFDHLPEKIFWLTASFPARREEKQQEYAQVWGCA